MREERAGAIRRAMVVDIVNVGVLIVMLNPFAIPECIDDLLGLIGGEENLKSDV